MVQEGAPGPPVSSLLLTIGHIVVVVVLGLLILNLLLLWREQLVLEAGAEEEEEDEGADVDQGNVLIRLHLALVRRGIKVTHALHLERVGEVAQEVANAADNQIAANHGSAHARNHSLKLVADVHADGEADEDAGEGDALDEVIPSLILILKDPLSPDLRRQGQGKQPSAVNTDKGPEQPDDVLFEFDEKSAGDDEADKYGEIERNVQLTFLLLALEAKLVVEDVNDNEADGAEDHQSHKEHDEFSSDEAHHQAH